MGAVRAFRRRWLTVPIFRWAQKALPPLSPTEAVAIEAGDTWWDSALFSGNPDWQALLKTPEAKLSTEEQAFLDGPVEEVCRMTDDWEVRFKLFDLPRPVWDFLKQQRFFGMIIPKEFGGLGFSAYAHSQVIRKLSSRSVTLAVTVMVPNSLGPGELLLQFGTPEQKKHYLPRLADGRDMPCFGLTSLEAGSDAAAMTDTAVVCHGEYEGKSVIGLRLNWSKRYITLCPVATLIGLAVKLHDPEHLLGADAKPGITVVLVPVDTPGVTTGRRHYPAHQVFQNGPTQGKDVFLPLDQVIGGKEQVGQGWKMLMSALAAGRGISLPSLSAAGAALSARTAGAYARIRRQFGLPISKFEGIHEPLSRIAGSAYAVDAARRLTCGALDRGHKPAVIAAIMKAHATEALRVVVNDAMDIHGGKAVMDGPHNYLGDLYRAVPVAITVEGANILTRNLMIFGQGAIRCHPYLLSEIRAIGAKDIDAFDKAFWGHVGHALRTFFRAWGRSWTRGRVGPTAGDAAMQPHFRQLSRYAAVLAFFSDIAFLTLGGGLKRRELISARLGDVLSELYLLSAVLKRFDAEGRRPEDRPLMDWCMAAGLSRLEAAIEGIIANFPNRLIAGLLRFIAPHDDRRRAGPSDLLTSACADLVTRRSDARDRLTVGLFPGLEGEPLALLEHALALTEQVEPLVKKLRDNRIHDWHAPEADSVLSTADREQLAEAEAAVHRASMVDDFDPQELRPQRDPARMEAAK
ncbi:MAG TPA: acyl-CoA dehydrogenase [Dongiaceae bacterium]|jgi:acyl-CoA dehydrogenase